MFVGLSVLIITLACFLVLFYVRTTEGLGARFPADSVISSDGITFKVHGSVGRTTAWYRHETSRLHVTVLLDQSETDFVRDWKIIDSVRRYDSALACGAATLLGRIFARSIRVKPIAGSLVLLEGRSLDRLERLSERLLAAKPHADFAYIFEKKAECGITIRGRRILDGSVDPRVVAERVRSDLLDFLLSRDG